MYGSPAFPCNATAPLDLAICIKLRMPSYMRAPPDAETMTTGSFNSVAFSTQRVTFSPTTEPILAPRKPKSITDSETSCPLILHNPATTASFSPVCRWHVRSEEHTSELQSPYD